MSVHTLPNSAQCASAAEADFRDFETLNNWPEHDDATCDAAAERLEKSPRYYFAEAGREWMAMREVELARDKVTEIPAPPIAGEPAGGHSLGPSPSWHKIPDPCRDMHEDFAADEAQRDREHSPWVNRFQTTWNQLDELDQGGAVPSALAFCLLVALISGALLSLWGLI